MSELGKMEDFRQQSLTAESERVSLWHHKKRRMSNESDLFEEGNIVCCLATKQVPLDEDDLAMPSQSSCIGDMRDIQCAIAGCSKVFDSLKSYELHYNSSHKNKCSECQRSFPSSHLLDIHILEWHDSLFSVLAEKKAMFQCLIQSCVQKFLHAEDRRNHMIRIHKYPANFRFDQRKSSSTVNRSKRNAIGQHGEGCMETDSPDNKPAKNKSETDKKTTPKTGRMFTYKVPQNICFGQGVSRGFHRGRGRGGRGRKHWYQKDQNEMNTIINIESVDMTDLSKALE